MLVNYQLLQDLNYKTFKGNDITSAKKIKGIDAGGATSKLVMDLERPLFAWVKEKNVILKLRTAGSAAPAAQVLDDSIHEFRDIIRAYRFDGKRDSIADEDRTPVLAIDVAAIKTKINALANITTITRGEQEELYYLELDAKFRGITRTFTIDGAGLITIVDTVEDADKEFISHSLITLHRDTAGQL